MEQTTRSEHHYKHLSRNRICSPWDLLFSFSVGTREPIAVESLEVGASQGSINLSNHLYLGRNTNLSTSFKYPKPESKVLTDQTNFQSRHPTRKLCLLQPVTSEREEGTDGTNNTKKASSQSQQSNFASHIYILCICIS
jgi:hypothetical protein